MPADAVAPPSAAESTDSFVRLHISPLDADLISIVLPAAVRSLARNVSFHTIETFPERRYGFVDLPQTEAEKLRKKLNGTTLKGSKMRIDKARPEERVQPDGDSERRSKKKKDKKETNGEPSSKKRKRDADVVEGVTLHDRKVKRGWTDADDHKKRRSKRDKNKKKDKDQDQDQDQDQEQEQEQEPGPKDHEKKKRLKSKYTEQDECLLKTKMPPNAMANLSSDVSRTQRKKGKGKSREVTIHEFEKTTKFPSFLKSSGAAANNSSATEFVEGKGWVDDAGNVVEAVKMTAQAASEPGRSKSVEKKTKKAKKPPVVESDDETSSSGSSTSEEEDSEDSEDSEPEPKSKSKAKPTKTVNAESESDDTDTSSSGSSSSSHSDDEQVNATPLSAAKDTSRPMSSNSATSLTIKIPPLPTTPSATTVHPLEALYKRPQPIATDETPAPKTTTQPFSFFAAGGDDDDEDMQDGDEQDTLNPPTAIAMPMTPFTRQDFESRTVRSAAPTPDTAHPSRMANFWAAAQGPDGAADEYDDEDDMNGDAFHEEDEDVQQPQDQQQQSKSDFQAWFWANRRDLNRSWMQRRKTAAKEKRHRENKARASKAA